MTSPTAHYKGDQRGIVGKAFGPTYLGEYLTADTAHYDEAENKTTVTFRYGVHSEGGRVEVSVDGELARVAAFRAKAGA